MAHYLLATYSVDDDTGVFADDAPSDGAPDPDAMQDMMQRVIALEAEMDASGTFVFGGHLHGVDAATVVHPSDGALMTDGPFAESKEHLAGFYIISADDLDEALGWARRVSACVGQPIEVQPFAGTGRVVDQFAD